MIPARAHLLPLARSWSSGEKKNRI